MTWNTIQFVVVAVLLLTASTNAFQSIGSYPQQHHQQQTHQPSRYCSFTTIKTVTTVHRRPITSHLKAEAPTTTSNFALVNNDDNNNGRANADVTCSKTTTTAAAAATDVVHKQQQQQRRRRRRVGLRKRVRNLVNLSIRFISSSVPKRKTVRVTPKTVVYPPIASSVVVVDDDDDDYSRKQQEAAAAGTTEEAIIVTNSMTKSLVAANTTDLSGVWKPLTNPTFLRHYDEYLQNCSQSVFFRKVVVNALGLTKDEIVQCDEGRSLTIVGINPAGTWNRTLRTDDTACTVVDPDQERVQVESYWLGSKHCSILRGKQRFLGGTFETIRYLDEVKDQLICESYFHPPSNTNSKFRPGFVKWTYERVQPKE
eukprot:CAMPEP_0194205346 /NCGR_PEP_ID=MMETSP0156-20130528/4647_1 /TAXON_ID=33649 /ORGANISM="Thalassionema nitzschioides, Strain L26-B" /LENGTH=368 /DNA_ID=CAMNT_0038931597 /DNA_START=51 /DNA_END=1160 /DNA_ORIENTATION=+